MKASKIFLNFNNDGFSIVELIMVLSILSTLGVIAIPNVFNTLKLNRIEEAKTYMNLYASECLEKFRAGEDITVNTPDFSRDKKPFLYLFILIFIILIIIL